MHPHDARTSAFDDDDPPSLTLARDCVHCGFCLASCPTYVIGGREPDSPRGRIELIRQGLEGEPMTGALVEHLDSCLGCLACQSACPSGVQYGKLLEPTRAQIERRGPELRPSGQRLLRRALFAVFPYPRRLRLLRAPLWLYQRLGIAAALRRSGLLSRLPASLAAMEAVAPPIRRRVSVPPRAAAVPPRRLSVGMLLGCVQRELYSHVNAATVEVLSAEGVEVVAPRRQGCCGALSLHTGRVEEARDLARRLIDAFADSATDALVVNAAGCGSTLKEYGELLADDPDYAARARELAGSVRDVHELLDELGPRAIRHPLPLTVAYHDACHLSHAQGIRRQPRDLLGQVPGLAVREVAEPDLCCGSAGVYNILQPQSATQLGERKAANVAATGAQLVVAANPGCLLQISAAMRRTGSALPSAHPIEVLAAALRGDPPSALLGP